MKRQSLTLYELNSLVRETIELDMPDTYWVEAELSEARESAGHCYMELIEKDEHTHTPIAKASAKCWRNVWTMIKPHFERTTGQPLRAGMKVLLQVYAQFHENYGFSWIVTDIDPTYTMGDMARKRQEIIRQLKAEGVFDLNKELLIPMFAQRIAVISSASAAGYGDFCRQLEENGHGFKFHVRLFNAVMQGEQVEASVISALNQINAAADDFDCVVIIRGGGATSDLSGFDTLALAENVANFPLPVITGIGHERDESVIDMVSNTRVKTPTAAAAFLIDNLSRTWERICGAEERLISIVRSRMQMEAQRLGHLSELIPRLFAIVKTTQEARIEKCLSRVQAGFQQLLRDSSHHLDVIGSRIPLIIGNKIQNEKHHIVLLSQRAEAVNPERLLSRGYSITLKDGKSVRNPELLRAGDEIETRLEKGTIKSIIK